MQILNPRTVITITGFVFQFLFGAINNIHAQCLSGDCMNGEGTFQLENGVYMGNFKNGEPNGEGAYVGLRYRGGSRVDSVHEEGIYRNGIFLKGKRTIIHSWEEIQVPSEWYKNKVGVWTGKAYRFESIYFENDFGKTWDYPFRKISKITITNGKGKSKSHEEEYLEFDAGATYNGDIKDGLPNGKGILTRSHGLTQFRFAGMFDQGMPVMQTDESLCTIYSPSDYPGLLKNTLYLRDMKFAEGRITNMTIKSNDTIYTFILQNPVIAINFIYKGEYDGVYKMTDASGNVYTGMLHNWIQDGNGELRYGNKIYTGMFKNGKFHGTGTVKQPNGTFSGLFVRGNFLRGEITTNDGQIKYPICQSGECENGKGKVSFVLKPTTANYKTYEGYLSNGLPNGQGTLSYKNGEQQTSITGTFLQGLLSGDAVYEGNIGIVTKMTGTFLDDTLKQGTVYYTDGSAFEFKTDLPPGINRNSNIVFTTSVNKKIVDGYGKYYTEGGAVVEGTFYLAGTRLLDGVYSDKEGNRIRMGYSVNNESISTDKLDWWGQHYAAQIKAEEETRRREAARYLADKQRAEQYAEAEKDPANFREVYKTVICSACNGKGYIISGYAVGSTSYVSQEYMDNSGNWRRDLKAFVPAHNVTSRTPCEACYKKGKVTIKMKEYIGPKF